MESRRDLLLTSKCSLSESYSIQQSKVGGLQISSANCKSANLRTSIFLKICKDFQRQTQVDLDQKHCFFLCKFAALRVADWDTCGLRLQNESKNLRICGLTKNICVPTFEQLNLQWCSSRRSGMQQRSIPVLFLVRLTGFLSADNLSAKIDFTWSTILF